MNHYPNREQVQALRERYPPGTLIQLTADTIAIASTASEYPLADFRFRGTPAPKHKNCLLG